jgi:hypothetical protein
MLRLTTFIYSSIFTPTIMPIKFSVQDSWLHAPTPPYSNIWKRPKGVAVHAKARLFGTRGLVMYFRWRLVEGKALFSKAQSAGKTAGSPNLQDVIEKQIDGLRLHKYSKRRNQAA